MNAERLKNYFINCFLLTIPIMLWNIAFANKLPLAFQPEIFWKNIPPFLKYGENITRIVVFMLTFFMPLNIKTATQKKGLFLYLTGMVFYCASWLILIYNPNLANTNILVFMAPAYLPILWLIGIGLIGNSFYFNMPYKPRYFIIPSIMFLLFHNFHAATIFLRVHL